MTEEIGGTGNVGLKGAMVGIRPETDPDDHVDVDKSDDEPKVEQHDEDPLTDEGGEG